MTVEVVRRPPGTKGCAAQARCWVVERMVWLGRHRRTTRDFERYENTSEALICLASCYLLLNRLQPAKVC